MTDELSTSEIVLAQLDAGVALPRNVYTSQGLFDQEMDAIFGRQWLYAGHVSQVPGSGDYLTLSVGTESAIVVRDSDGAIHGLLNVCRHRGSRLTTCASGTARRFTCPYHQWTYRHDGTLVGAPRMTKDFDPSSYPLRRLHTAVWHGLIFVNFSLDDTDGTDDLATLLGNSDALLEPFDIGNARIAHTEAYEVDANWKLVWENSQECYHCNANHPEFIRTFDVGSLELPTLEDAPAYYTSDRRAQGGQFPLKEGACSLTMSGAPASGRPLGRFAEGLGPYTAATHLKPGFACVFSPDYGVVVADIPVAPDRTRVQVQWLVHPDAEEGTDYQVDDLIRVWDQTNRQDWELCRSVQQGVASRGFVPGPLSLDESSVAGFYYAYARMLASAGL